MATQNISGGIDETKWPHQHVTDLFDKYIKDNQQDTYDVASEIDGVFKDIGLQFELTDYEDLLKDAKQTLSSDMFVTKKEFEDLLCEWIMLFKEEISSSLLTECLDIIQVKYRDSAEQLEDVLKIVSGGGSEINVDQLPQFIQEATPVLEIRIVDLKNKKPKSDASVCDDEQEQEFYSQIVLQAKKDNYTTLNLQDIEKILIDYFKGFDAQYSFVLLKNYDSDNEHDPDDDLDDDEKLLDNPKNDEMDEDEHLFDDPKNDEMDDDAYLEETEYQIQVAESEGNVAKADKHRQIKQYIYMRKQVTSKEDLENVEEMIEKVKKEIDDLEKDITPDPFNESPNPYEDEQLDDEINYGQYNQDAGNYDSDGMYSGNQMRDINKKKSPSPYPEEEHAYKQESFKNESKMMPQHQPLGPSRFSNREQLEIERRLEDEPQESLDEKRNRGIKEIFDFYTRQHLMIGKKATFDQIQYSLSNMNMGEFMKFCKDFKIPVSNIKCAEIFKKIAKNSKEMFIEHFNESFPKLIEMRNREELENLEKRLKEVRKLVVKRKRKLEVDDTPDDNDEDRKRPGLTMQQLAQQADDKLDMLQNTLERKASDSADSDDNKAPKGGVRDSQLIGSQNSGNLKAKGGDPHGAVARMQEKELQDIRKEVAEKNKKVI
jgi:hypothetical protein